MGSPVAPVATKDATAAPEAETTDSVAVPSAVDVSEKKDAPPAPAMADELEKTDDAPPAPATAESSQRKDEEGAPATETKASVWVGKYKIVDNQRCGQEEYYSVTLTVNADGTCSSSTDVQSQCAGGSKLM